MIIVYWLFIKPIIDTKKAALSGEVMLISKQKRGSGHIIEVKEDNQIKFVRYDFVNDDVDIQIGDSLFKQPNAPLFVKSKADDEIRLANDQSIIISE